MPSLLEIIAGNACSLGAMISDSVSGTRKKREEILGVQIISQFFYAAGSIILKGYSATAQNAVAVLRNLAAIKNIKNKVVERALILRAVILGALFNNRGLIGWLPIVANLEYSVAMFRFTDNARRLKFAFLINSLMFVTFNIVILNYVGAVSGIIVSLTTGISLIRGSKAEESGKEEYGTSEAE